MPSQPNRAHRHRVHAVSSSSRIPVAGCGPVVARCGPTVTGSGPTIAGYGPTVAVEGPAAYRPLLAAVVLARSRSAMGGEREREE
jgi:tartrate dehydratase beta subunit/fumarate hydratase class I family protein